MPGPPTCRLSNLALVWCHVHQKGRWACGPWHGLRVSCVVEGAYRASVRLGSICVARSQCAPTPLGFGAAPPSTPPPLAATPPLYLSR